MREIAFGDGADDARDFGGRLNEIDNESVYRLNAIEPRASRVAQDGALGDASFLSDGVADTLQFNGANVNENMTLSANGSRARLTRDVGNVVMDVNGLEQVNIAALGGADTISVNDLTGTGITGVNLDLAGTPGTGNGDGQADTVIVNGTNGDDAISSDPKTRVRRSRPRSVSRI